MTPKYPYVQFYVRPNGHVRTVTSKRLRSKVDILAYGGVKMVTPADHSEFNKPKLCQYALHLFCNGMPKCYEIYTVCIYLHRYTDNIQYITSPKIPRILIVYTVLYREIPV